MMNPVTTTVAAVQIADSILAAAHEKLIVFMLTAIGLIAVMWGFNAIGLEAINWGFFFVGGMVILIALTGPRKVLAAVGIGVAITGAAPTREAIMKGSLVGLKGLYMLILGTLLYFWMIAGFLATWSFKENPAAFVPFAAGILLLVVLNAYFEKKSEKWTIRLVTAYALFIIGMALFSTKSESAKQFFGWEKPNQEPVGLQTYAPTETSGPQLSRLGSFTVKVAPGGRSVDIISFDNARLRYEWVAGPTSVEVHPQDGAGNPLPRQAKYWLELPASASGDAFVRFYREK